MSEKPTSYNTDLYEHMSEATIAAASVTASYATLLSLGTVYFRNNMIIENTLDQAVKLNFVEATTNNEITISAETDYVFDDFIHNGTIQIKAKSSLPTSGELIMKCW